MGETRVDLLHLLDHIALAAALALAPLAVEAAHEHAFVTAFLTRWGDAVARDRSAVRSSR